MSSGTATSGMLEVSLAPRRSLSPMDADRTRHSRRSLTPGDARQARSRSASPYGDLSSKVALFNKHASDHMQGQAINPFSGDGRVSPRPRIDKTDASYGKPVGKTALRGLKAQSQVSKEILELCEVIAENGESLSDGPGDDDPRTAISFGNLFHIYTYISNKVVGILLRARKQKLLDFEGETLFQKRDDHVPIIMLKRIQEIRDIFRSAEQKERELRKQQERELYLQEHPEVLIEEEMRRAYEAELAEEAAEETGPTAEEFQLRVEDTTAVDNSPAAVQPPEVIVAEHSPEPSPADKAPEVEDLNNTTPTSPAEQQPTEVTAEETSPSRPEPSPANKAPEVEDLNNTTVTSPADEPASEVAAEEPSPSKPEPSPAVNVSEVENLKETTPTSSTEEHPSIVAVEDTAPVADQAPKVEDLTQVTPTSPAEEQKTQETSC